MFQVVTTSMFHSSSPSSSCTHMLAGGVAKTRTSIYEVSFPLGESVGKKFCLFGYVFFYFSCSLCGADEEQVFIVIFSLCGITCLIIEILNSISKRWPIIIDRLVISGVEAEIWGLFLRERAPLECGISQKMCVCFESFQQPILQFCLRLPN